MPRGPLCVYVFMCICMCACVGMYMCACVYACPCVCAYMHVCMFTCVCLWVCGPGPLVWSPAHHRANCFTYGLHLPPCFLWRPALLHRMVHLQESRLQCQVQPEASKCYVHVRGRWMFIHARQLFICDIYTCVVFFHPLEDFRTCAEQ